MCDSNLLDSKADGIEVSYNACGVLSHIMFDGPEVWSMEEPRRDTVMDKMWDAIQSWDVSSRRNINYRFCPLSPLQPSDLLSSFRNDIVIHFHSLHFVVI